VFVVSGTDDPLATGIVMDFQPGVDEILFAT
jgi:hypothetical protein